MGFLNAVVGRHTTLVMHSSSGKSLIQISSQYSFVIKAANDMAGKKAQQLEHQKEPFTDLLTMSLPGSFLIFKG